jgi:hypothetical protein
MFCAGSGWNPMGDRQGDRCGSCDHLHRAVHSWGAMHAPRGNRRRSHDCALGWGLEHESLDCYILGSEEAFGHDEHRGRDGPQSEST